MDQYQAEFRLSHSCSMARELAERYHREAEAFDRTVCTGPIIDGAIQPANHRELAAINRNAAELRARLMAEAAHNGIERAEMAWAIARLGR